MDCVLEAASWWLLLIVHVMQSVHEGLKDPDKRKFTYALFCRLCADAPPRWRRHNITMSQSTPICGGVLYTIVHSGADLGTI